MIDIGAAVFLIGAVGLLVACALKWAIGFTVPKFEEFVLILGTMAVVGLLVMVKTAYDVALFITIAGAIGLLAMMFVNFPKRLTEICTFLVASGGIALVIMGML